MKHKTLTYLKKVLLIYKDKRFLDRQQQVL